MLAAFAATEWTALLLPLLRVMQSICGALSSGQGIAEATAQSTASGNADAVASAIAEAASGGGR